MDSPFHTLGNLGGIKWRNSVKIQEQKSKIAVWVNNRNPSAAKVSFHICLTLPVAQPCLQAGRPADMHSSS